MGDQPGDWGFAQKAGLLNELDTRTETGGVARNRPLGIVPPQGTAAKKEEQQIRARYKGSRVRFQQFDINEPSEVDQLEEISTKTLQEAGWYLLDKRFSFSKDGKALVCLNWIEPDPRSQTKMPEAWSKPETHTDKEGNPFLIQPPYPAGVPPTERAPGNHGADSPEELMSTFSDLLAAQAQDDLPAKKEAPPEEDDAS